MKWLDKPGKDGIYWHEYDGYISICRVECREFDKRYLIDFIGGKHTFSLDELTDCKWYGPITKPERS